MDLDSLRDAGSEGALEIIENIAGAGNHYHLAVNLPNQGQIANLPKGAIVETPGGVSGAGVQGVAMGSLPEGIAELCRRELSYSSLLVDACYHGDQDLALQALLFDPMVNDIDRARAILSDFLSEFAEYLPQFKKG